MVAGVRGSYAWACESRQLFPVLILDTWLGSGGMYGSRSGRSTDGARSGRG